MTCPEPRRILSRVLGQGEGAVGVLHLEVAPET